MTRHCRITSGAVENKFGCGDGAYDLFEVAGSPEAIGTAITDSLRTLDLYNPQGGDAIADRGEVLSLVLTIKVSDHPISDKEAWPED